MGLQVTASPSVLPGGTTVAGSLAVAGAAGLNGNAPVVKAGAIAAPTAPGAVYTQAEATSTVTAVNAIRAALTNIGITA